MMRPVIIKKIRTRGSAPKDSDSHVTSSFPLLCPNNDSLILEERQFLQYLRSMHHSLDGDLESKRA